MTVDGSGVVEIDAGDPDEVDRVDGDGIDGGVDRVRLAAGAEPEWVGRDDVDAAEVAEPAEDGSEVGDGGRVVTAVVDAAAGGECGMVGGACNADAGRTRK